MTRRWKIIKIRITASHFFFCFNVFYIHTARTSARLGVITERKMSFLLF